MIRILIKRFIRFSLCFSVSFFAFESTFAGTLSFRIYNEPNGTKSVSGCIDQERKGDSVITAEMPLSFCENDPNLKQKFNHMWKIDPSNQFINGCRLVFGNDRFAPVIGEAPLDACVSSLGIKIDWVIEADTIKSCKVISNVRNMPIEGLNLSQCLEYEKSKIKYLYIYSTSAKSFDGCQKVLNGAVIDGSRLNNQLCSSDKIPKDLSKVLLQKSNSRNLKLEDVANHWLGEDKSQCVNETTDSFVITGAADKKLCSDSHIIYSTKGERVIKFSFDNELVDYIRDVFDIPDGGVIADTVYTKYQTKMIARSLVARQRKKQSNLYKTSTENYDYYKNSSIHLSFRDELTEPIIKNCFLNQHQTGRSGGHLGPSRRRDQESKLLAINFSTDYDRSQNKNKINELLPKYAYLNLNPSPSKVIRATQYGNNVAVFKNNIYDRVTWTNGDSLNLSASNAFTLFLRGPAIALSSVSSAYYYEAQIWGPACVDDVEYFMVGCHKNVDSTVINALKETKRKVFECLLDSKNNTQEYKKGKEL